MAPSVSNVCPGLAGLAAVTIAAKKVERGRTSAALARRRQLGLAGEPRSRTESCQMDPPRPWEGTAPTTGAGTGASGHGSTCRASPRNGSRVDHRHGRALVQAPIARLGPIGLRAVSGHLHLGGTKGKTSIHASGIMGWEHLEFRTAGSKSVSAHAQGGWLSMSSAAFHSAADPASAEMGQPRPAGAYQGTGFSTFCQQ